MNPIFSVTRNPSKYEVMANSTPQFQVVIGGTSNRLPSLSPMLEEAEVEEMRLAPRERVAELAA